MSITFVDAAGLWPVAAAAAQGRSKERAAFFFEDWIGQVKCFVILGQREGLGPGLIYLIYR
jgi:hypothetical protein